MSQLLLNILRGGKAQILYVCRHINAQNQSILAVHIRLLASNSQWSVGGLCNFYVVQATSAKCGLDLANVKLNAQSEECISTRTTVCITLFLCTTCAIKTCNVQPRPGCFLISNVSSGNITLCHELQVERGKLSAGLCVC
jgi:hypothetical protein